MPPLIAPNLIVNPHRTLFCATTNSPESYLFYRRLNSSVQVISRLGSNVELFTSCLACESLQLLPVRIISQGGLNHPSNYRCFSFSRFQLIRSSLPYPSSSFTLNFCLFNSFLLYFEGGFPSFVLRYFLTNVIRSNTSCSNKSSVLILFCSSFHK